MKTELKNRTAALLNIAGLVGIVLIVIGSLVSGLAYEGRQGQSYRVWNHFVSELGERGVSELAWAFNGGLILGGACIVAYVVSLMGRLTGWFRFVIAPIGFVAGVFAALVGVFPMNNVAAHVFVANGFFYPGMITMLLFSLYVLLNRSRDLPRWVAIPGFVAAAALFLFLFLGDVLETAINGDAVLGFGTGRPEIWVSALFEWVAIGAVLAWIAAVASILAVRDFSGAE